MNRFRTHLLLQLILSLSALAGTIRVDEMNTFDTGTRLLNGRWIVGSTVKMTWLNAFGNVAVTDWNTWHYIIDIGSPATIASTGYVPRNTDTWTSTISGTADFSSCYQGKATGQVTGFGGDTKEVGGNHVCTDSRPIYSPPCEWRPEGCGEPISNCPLIVNTGRGAWNFSGLDDSVLFDIDADGHADRIAWTARGSSLAFIALDRNSNGAVDNSSELFGDHTPLSNGSVAPNGFAALKAFDVNGDDQIDQHDPVWARLLLWNDTNHDGTSQPNELTPLSQTDIRALGIEYHWMGRTDANGNAFRFQGKLAKEHAKEPYYDIYFSR